MTDACSSASRTATSRARSRSRASCVALGYQLVATRGTAAALTAAGVPVTPVNKVAEGRPHIVDMIKNDEIALVVNTVEEKRAAIQDSYAIRRAALTDQVPTYTTLAGRTCRGHRHGAHARPRSVFDPGAARRALRRGRQAFAFSRRIGLMRKDRLSRLEVHAIILPRSGCRRKVRGPSGMRQTHR